MSGRKYKSSYNGAGNSTTIKSDGINTEFKVINTGDTFLILESDAGIYITVTLHFGNIICTERLYGMNRDEPEFWLYERQWSGEGHKTGGNVRYKRDMIYPVGKQVLIGERKNKDDAAKQVHGSAS